MHGGVGFITDPNVLHSADIGLHHSSFAAGDASGRPPRRLSAALDALGSASGRTVHGALNIDTSAGGEPFTITIVRI